MVRVIRAAALCGLALLSPFCIAGPYAGVSGVLSTYEYEDVDQSAGWQGYLGYRFEQTPMLLEIAYQDVGEADIEDFSETNGDSLRDASLSFNGYSFFLGYAPVVDSQGSSLWAKLGYYSGDSRIRGRFDSPSLGVSNFPLDSKETSSGLAWALGGEKMMSSKFGLRGEIGALSDVKDLPGFDSDHKSDITQISLGLVWRFGAPDNNAEGTSPRPAAAPIQSPSPIDLPPAPMAPVGVPQAPPLPAGPMVAVDTILRAQPKSSSSGLAKVAAGAPLTIQGELTNEEGRWIYASVGRDRGWLSAGEVRKP